VDALELCVVTAIRGFLWDVPAQELLQDIRKQHFIGVHWPEMQSQWEPPPSANDLEVVTIWQASTKPPPPPPPVAGPSTSGYKPPWKKAKVEAGDIMMCSEVYDCNYEIDYDV